MSQFLKTKWNHLRWPLPLGHLEALICLQLINVFSLIKTYHLPCIMAQMLGSEGPGWPQQQLESWRRGLKVAPDPVVSES